MTDDPFQLDRFVEAQGTTFASALSELQAGRKRTHWMWFVFPQIAGLGHSAMAARYAIRSHTEAEAYLDHPLLGPRLRDCTGLVLMYANRTPYEIFGTPDDLKFRSSMTLFDAISPKDVFSKALKNLCQNELILKRFSSSEAARSRLGRLASSTTQELKPSAPLRPKVIKSFW